jgi:hypothetical protein
MVDKGSIKLVASIDTTNIADARDQTNILQGQVSQINSTLASLSSKKEELKAEADRVLTVVEGMYPVMKLLQEHQQRLFWEIDGLDKALAASEAKKSMIADMQAKAYEIEVSLDRSRRRIDDRLDEVEELRLKIAAEEKKVKQSKINAWHFISSFLHLADRMLDRTGSEFAQAFGTAVSGITSTVSSLHAVSVALAASGPAGWVQAGIIVASNTMATYYALQALQNAQQLRSNNDYLANIEASNAPW